MFKNREIRFRNAVNTHSKKPLSEGFSNLKTMKHLSFSIVSVLLLLSTLSCSNNEEAGHSHGEDANHEHGEAAHTHETAEGEDHQDAQIQKAAYSKEETLTKSSKGIRLSLSFGAGANAFTGTVENTTEEKLCGVEVTAAAENGTSFDAIEVGDLEAGQSKEVQISSEGTTFENWSAETNMAACGSQTHTHDDGEEHDDH
jgi:hypothetical protein